MYNLKKNGEFRENLKIVREHENTVWFEDMLSSIKSCKDIDTLGYLYDTYRRYISLCYPHNIYNEVLSELNEACNYRLIQLYKIQDSNKDTLKIVLKEIEKKEKTQEKMEKMLEEMEKEQK